MGKLNMVRVDYRMVHGQIVAKWIKFRPVDRLILADDSLVDDPFMGDIYRMAVPDREVDIVKLGDVQTASDRKNDTAHSASPWFRGLHFPLRNMKNYAK